MWVGGSGRRQVRWVKGPAHGDFIKFQNLGSLGVVRKPLEGFEQSSAVICHILDVF